LSTTGSENNLQIALPIFLQFVSSGGTATSPSPPPLQCDFISLHAKGDWLEYQLPNLAQVIDTVESTVSQFTSLPAFNGYFDNKPIVNDESDMRVGDQVPFYPRMTSQFPAWLTALMIANDSLTSEYASKGGAQFVGGSDNAHLELVGWQQSSLTMSGEQGFGQQRSIMTAASAWSAGTPSSPVCPQDLVKLPVYNFYELLRLLGDQHGVFISGQENFYPTDPNSDLFSAITVGHRPGNLPMSVGFSASIQPTFRPREHQPRQRTGPVVWKSSVCLPAGPASTGCSSRSGRPQKAPRTKTASRRPRRARSSRCRQCRRSENPVSGDWEYELPTPPTQVDVSAFDAGNVRLAQELGLVQYRQDVSLTGGTWKSPAAVDFEPYSATVFWITQYDPTVIPATPIAASYTLPDQTVVPIAVATLVGANVVIQWWPSELCSIAWRMSSDRSIPILAQKSVATP
jgi:hypothetical protein